MTDISEKLARLAERFPEQERFGEALNLLLTNDEDKQELAQRIESGELDDSGEVIRVALEMQEKRDAEV